ncbi:MAG: glycosyltransferase [Paludibacteraceae bacterium]
MNDRIQHLIGLSENELNLIYNKSVCLIHPSLYEGFGVPVIEAMKAKCPVLAYQCPAVNEIGLDGITYFKSYDTKSVNMLINSMMNKENAELTNKAYKIADRFSWEKTGIETINLFNKVLSTI